MMLYPELQKSLDKAITQLLEYCKRNDWAGWDPFDGLSSRVFSAFPFTHHRIPRLIFIQSFKRLPVNLRPVFLVPREQNPKGLALFCSALIHLVNSQRLEDNTLVISLLDRLVQLRSPGKPYYCWGYNFDWQNRRFFLPKYEPNIIATTFAGNALLDAFERYSEQKYLETAESAAQFLLRGLHITKHDGNICFSYTPLDYGQIHNANLLGAAYLARLYEKTGEKKFLDFSIKAMRFSIQQQNADGSWYYGEDKTQKWIDNFHTGYNLIAIHNFRRFSGSNEFESHLKRGYEYYLNHLFTEDGLPKYFHNRLYPIDIHSLAQSMITLVELKHLDPRSEDLVRQIFTWSIQYMQNGGGYFYYQKRRFYTNRIPYMRWSQAWMLYALSVLAGKSGANIAPKSTTNCRYGVLD
ncbi:MAG: hypothetical protein HUU32_18410 [Calditrichaceae bacterium]|nr:hypothetical protein [Calditrichaceae bacterium]